MTTAVTVLKNCLHVEICKSDIHYWEHGRIDDDVEIDWIADSTEPPDNVKEAFERARDDDDMIKWMITIGR